MWHLASDTRVGIRGIVFVKSSSINTTLRETRQGENSTKLQDKIKKKRIIINK